jgi:hypothetical protein
MTKEINDQWSFIEKYYPNYSTSKKIAENEDLAKLISGEQEEGDDANELLKQITEIVNFKFPAENNEGRQKQIEIEIKNRFYKSSLILFLKSVKAFQEQQITE